MQLPLPKGAYVIALLLLLAGVVIVYRIILVPQPLMALALDVGEKGSAILVRTNDRQTILVDTGPDASILRALGQALPFWERSIDVLILTSQKKAAVGGLPDVLRRYTVAKQVTLTESQRLVLSDGSYIDIALTKNAPAGVSVFDGKATTKVR